MKGARAGATERRKLRRGGKENKAAQKERRERGRGEEREKKREKLFAGEDGARRGSIRCASLILEKQEEGTTRRET